MIALVWDRYAASGKKPLRGRVLYLNYFGPEVSVHSSKFIAGVMFIVMGGVTVGLGVTSTMIAMPGTALVRGCRLGSKRLLSGSSQTSGQ